jgi:hypothetical protein
MVEPCALKGFQELLFVPLLWGPKVLLGPRTRSIFSPPPVSCDPEPAVNLAFIDLNAGITNHLSVLNNSDQTFAYQVNVGPADDLRKAVQATAVFMNFGISSNYLGATCGIGLRPSLDGHEETFQNKSN